MTALIAPKKLPKRAQAVIDRLKRDVEHWRAQALAAASADPDATNVVVVDVLGQREHGLPPNTGVRFRVGKHSFQVQIDGDALSVYAVDGPIVIRPVVSNVIHIRPEE